MNLPFVNLSWSTSVAGALLMVGQPSGALPAPQVTVTPSTGLTDGAPVAVSATGFPLGEAATVVECANMGGEVVVCDLDNAVEVVTGADGQVTTSITVHRTFEGYDAAGNLVATDRARAPRGCAIAVATVSAVGSAAAISFA